MLGAYVRLTSLVKLETLIEAVSGMVPSRVDANVQALKQAYDSVTICQAEEMN